MRKGDWISNEERIARALQRYVINIKTECWEYTGKRRRLSGYGMVVLRDFVRGNKYHREAHRIFYANLVGPIPEGKELHHKCHNTKCVNPKHLIPLTREEHRAQHTYESGGYFGINDTHCSNGHEYTSDNLRWYVTKQGTTTRVCKQCGAEKMRRLRLKWGASSKPKDKAA